MRKCHNINSAGKPVLDPYVVKISLVSKLDNHEYSCRCKLSKNIVSN